MNSFKKNFWRGIVLAGCIFLLTSLCAKAQFNKLISAEPSLALLKTSLSDSDRVKIVDDLGWYYLMKPGEEKADRDSAFKMLDISLQLSKKLNDPAWLGKYYLLLSMIQHEGKDTVNGKMNLDMALHIFREHKLFELEGDATQELNQYYPCRTDEEAAVKIPVLQKMISLYELADAKNKQGTGLVLLGELFAFMDQDEKAALVLQKALSILQANHYDRLQGVYDLLGNCYRGIGDMDKAIKYGLLAVQTAQQVQDTGMNVTLYNRLALSFYRANMLSEANIYFNKSFQAAKNISDTSGMILVGAHLAEVYLALRRPQDALKQLRQFEKNYGTTSPVIQANLYCSMATTLTDLGRFEESWNYIKKMMDMEALIGSSDHEYKVIVHYYLATNNFRKVADYADSLETNNRKRNTRLEASLVHLWRFKADSAMGNLNSAIAEYQLYKLMEDSVLNEKNRNEITRLNIVYESDRKDNDIQSNELKIVALEKEDKLKTAEIEKARINRNIIIIGTLASLVLLALSYNQYRIKQKSNRSLLVKQREINDQNLQLHHLVEDKEWLVKEIHHRVKNNLQLVMSLLNTQADYSDNEHSSAAIRESRQRMFAMSLIHQKLYQAEQLTVVNMSVYIPELIDFLKDSFTHGDRVRFDLNIASIELDVTQAVPVGLILNELVTNSIKYAFTGISKGLIRVHMNMELDGSIDLMVCDNGVGLPSGVEPKKNSTMGMQLVRTLVEQLGGTVDFKNDKGLNVKFSFKQKLIPHQITA